MKCVVRFGALASLVSLIAGCGQNTLTSPSHTPAASAQGSFHVMTSVSSSSGTGFIGRFDALAIPPRSNASPIVPSVPANLTASVRGNTVTLTWAGAGGNPTDYIIEAGSLPGAANLAQFGTGNPATTFMAGNVPPGTYFVRVRARNTDGISGASNEVSLSVGGACTTHPNPPGNLAASVNGNTVTLTWQTPVADGMTTSYVLEAGSSSGASDLFNADVGNANSLQATAPNGTYYARVRGRNPCGIGGPSNEVTFVVGGGTPPPTPSVRWVGVAPAGIIVEQDPYDQCPAEYDLQLDLTPNGTEVTGTAITRLRKVEAAGDCSDVLGEVATWTVTNGRVGSGTISFALGNTGTFRFSGTLTATRMTGTVFIRESTINSQTGSFAVSRQ